MSTPRQPPIAIVGIGCLFPQSPDLSAYWRNILDARDCLTDVPKDHSWTVEDYYSADVAEKDKSWATRGGFLDKVPFDPIAHGVPPNMLESIDTTQLLSLIVARECLRDAGVDPDGEEWDRDRVACILGITGTQEMAITAGSRLQGPTWRRALERCGITGELQDAVVADIGNHFPTWTEQTFPGLLGNVVAGRIANRLDLGGTNCVVDAACASSLAAMQYAIGDLTSGRSDVVLTGGADCLNDAFMFQCFTRTPAFTKTGDARPFDASADGILIGEGIAIVALKRLEDAERDGDRVYAVIKGLGSSSDGRHKSIYAPNSGGQAKALRRTYDMAGVTVDSVELVEAHGTGTKAGDAAEVAGLTAVYEDAERDDRWVALGSVKAQIGHTKSTAGAAGLVKVALALHNRILPPAAKIEQPNPRMSFETSPFYLSTRPRPWVRAADHPRRAAVSAFGFGGSNFHALLEEHGDHRPVAHWAAEGELFLFGGSSSDDLRAQLDAAEAAEAPTLAHRARSVLQAWTPGATHVLGFVVDSSDDLARRFSFARKALQGMPVPGVHYGSDLSDPGPVAFLFPGQGSQYVEMGRSAALRHAPLLAALDAADEHFRCHEAPRISRDIFPPAVFTEGDAATQEIQLRQTDRAQPALGALSAGFLHTLARFGVTPDLAAGHSYGELVALHAAGVLTLDDLWTASRLRGQRMASLPGDNGTMAAVNGPLETIEQILSTLDQGVVLANRNHPTQGVISGSTEAVNQAMQALVEAGLEARLIPVSAAFHSPLVADAAAPFAEDLAQISLNQPTIPVWSTVTAQPHEDNPDAIRAALVDQITAPVDFVGVVENLWSSGARVFVECGPKGVLSGLTRATLGDREAEATVVAVDAKRDAVDGDVQLKDTLAALAAAGLPIDVQPLLEEQLPIPPRTPGSVATVFLGGANHRNPTTLEPPMPEIPDSARPSSPTSDDPIVEAGWAAIPTTGTPVSKPPPMAKSEPQHAPAGPADPPVALGAPMAATGGLAARGDLAALLESTRSTLEAFQTAQQQTAEVHGRFLDAWSEASRNFTRLFETHARLVEMAATGQVATPAQPITPAPALPSAPLPAFASPSVAAEPPPAETVLADPTSSLGGIFAPISEDEPGRVATPSSSRPAVSGDLPPLLDAAMAVEEKARPPAPAPAASGPTASRDTLTQATLAAVSEKTGYPMEMLELGMDLESDLGVDSIKRVEILGAVQEQVQGLPELDNERMSALRTLAEVVDYLEESLGGVSRLPGHTVDIPAGPGPDQLADATLDAVAAKTGYPREMLELGMDLESDLGVDSIKRVEILGAVQEAIDGLPELDNERMSALRTLNDVVQYLVEAAGARTVPEFTNPIFEARRGISGDQMHTALMDAVASKTGYPREMLDLGMDLESDLGVDSIKRVEILGAVQEALPDLPELDNDTMSKLRTLQAVVDHLIRVEAGLGFATTVVEAPQQDLSTNVLVPLGAPATAPPVDAGLPPLATAAELLDEPEVALRRREVRVVEAPEGQTVALAEPVVITADTLGRAEQVAQALSATGVEATLVDIDWANDDAIESAFSTPVGTLIHFAAAGTTEVEALRARVRGAFLAVRAAGADLGCLVTISHQGGRFGLGDAEGHWLEGALAGLPKTLALEQPTMRCLALDLHPDTTPEQIAAAVQTDRGAIEVGLTPEPVVLQTVAAPRQAGESSPVDKGDLVVVSGGAKGVTARCVIALAEAAQPAFLLLGRSELPDSEPDWASDVDDSHLQAAWLADCAQRGEKPSPRAMDQALRGVRGSREIRATLESVRAAGSVVTYAAVDVRSEDDIRAALAPVVSDHGPVRGLIHGAGVLADKRVFDKTTDAFDRVFATKVDGWVALLAACDTEDLAFTIGFTSVAGRFGNPGQCDYAMANEALVHAGFGLERRGVQALSLDWGPWDGGMVTPELKRSFAARGLTAIPLELGARAMVAELQAGTRGEVVLEGPRTNRGSTTRAFGLHTDPWLADHTIGTRPSVPVAVVLEWVAQVAREVYPGLQVVAVRDLAVLKGVVVDNGSARTTLSWHPAAAREGVTALAFELQGPPGPLGMPVVHYRAVVDLGEALPTTKPFPGSNGLSAGTYEHAIDEAYQNFLFHGPAFRGIDEIVGISDEGIVGWVRTGGQDALGVGGTWQTDPLAIDCALQLVLLWVRDRIGAAALPSLVREYKQFRPFPERVAAHIHLSKINDKRGTFSATLVDDQDNIIAVLDQGEYTADPTLNPAFREQR